MSNQQLNKRDFLKMVAAFLAFFSVGGVSTLFKNSLNKSDSGYGNRGYGA